MNHTPPAWLTELEASVVTYTGTVLFDQVVLEIEEKEES